MFIPNKNIYHANQKGKLIKIPTVYLLKEYRTNKKKCYIMKEYPNNQKGVLCILYETNKNLFSILHTDTDRSDNY